MAPSPTPSPTSGMPTAIAISLNSLSNDSSNVQAPAFCTYPNISEVKHFCSMKGAYCAELSASNPYPKLCVPGNYCRNAWVQSWCPKNHFCPLGADKPRLCSSLFSGMACQGVGQSYPNLFLIFAVIFLIFFPIVVVGAYLDMRVRKTHTRQMQRQEATLQEDLQDKQNMLEAAKHVRAALAMTLAARLEDELIVKHPRDRFRRAVRQVIRLSRELRQRQARIARSNKQQQQQQGGGGGASAAGGGGGPSSSLGDTMVRDLSRQVQRLTRFEEITEPLTISFEGLSMTVGETRIIQNLSGAINAKTTCALMGPSGAGKTSLMTLLRGRAHYGTITGTMGVNGKVVTSLADYSEFMGFVPQEDVMYEELTVEENIFFSCMLFSRKDAWSRLDDTRHLVNDVVSILGLHKVRNSVIGNSEVRGVSGGQRKRVNVGMELVKGPRILFLDEPTSGLDSSTSVALMETLSALATFGMTIAATIHQPRYEIFEKMNDIILLAPGGRMIYCGKTSKIEQYFSKMGYQCPAKVNVADYVMDVLCGLVRSQTGLVGSEAVQDYLVSNWPTERKGFESHGPTSRATRRRTVRRFYQEPDLNNESTLAKFRTQLAFVAYRQIQRFARSWRTVLVDLLSIYLVGSIVGLLFGPMTVGTSAFQSQIMVLELAYGFLTSSAALRTFGSDRVVYLREESSGIWILPYYLGKLVGVLPYLFLQPAAFLLSFYSLARPQQTSNQFYGSLWCLSYVIYAVGNFIGVSVGSKSQNTATVCVMILFWCANGVTLKPADLKKNFGAMGSLLYSCSYFRFTTQALMVAEFQTFSQAVQYTYKKRYFKTFWLADDQLSSSWRHMLLYGFLVHVITVLYLYWSFDECQGMRRLKAAIIARLPSGALRAFGNCFSRLRAVDNMVVQGVVRARDSAYLACGAGPRRWVQGGGGGGGGVKGCLSSLLQRNRKVRQAPLMDLEEYDGEQGTGIMGLTHSATPLREEQMRQAGGGQQWLAGQVNQLHASSVAQGV